MTADIVLVLSGQPYLRVPEAARIYHQGLSPKILLVNAPRPRGQAVRECAGFVGPWWRGIWRTVVGGATAVLPPIVVR